MPSELAHHWTITPGLAFLNHGSYGATPRAVLEAQDAWRARMEREPVAFFARDLEPALDVARRSLAGFVGAHPDDLAFVANATAGINELARAVDLRPGDEILVTDHAYTAARNALEAACVSAGARIATVELPFPGTSPETVVDRVVDAVGPRTRLVMVDHVTSPTALVLPVAELVAAVQSRGPDVLVDGAHGPGMVELDLDAIGAAYYVANCHKWLLAPKGSGFVHVRRDRQDRVRPLAISHGATSPRTDRSRFRLEHDWIGTLDPTAWLATPAAIEFGVSIGGWAALRERGRALALEGRDLVCAAMDVLAPAPDAMIGSMVAVPLPAQETGTPPLALYDDPLHAALLEAGVQVAVSPWPRTPGQAWHRLIRFSVAPYVGRDDLERLALALTSVLARA